MTPANVLVMARDAGAAAALAPVARGLVDSDRHGVSVVAYGKAVPVFERHGLPVTAFPDQPTPEQVERLLIRERSAAVLTGTSMRPERDRIFWQAAAAAGVPSIALLDHWCNYAERFSHERPFDSLPDRVAVMDDAAFAELKAAGCPPERLVVTGQPHFEDIGHGHDEERRAAARRELGVEPGRTVAVFASEPQARYYGASEADSGYLGYTERDSLLAVVAALSELAPEALLVVKLHPLEEPDAFHDLAEAHSSPEIRTLRAYPPAKLLAAADVVFGMTSVMLLEAAHMGLPAFSVRPGGGPDHFLEVHAEQIASITRADALRNAVSGGLDQGGLRPVRAAFGEDAVKRVVHALEQAIADAPALTVGR